MAKEGVAFIPAVGTLSQMTALGEDIQQSSALLGGGGQEVAPQPQRTLGVGCHNSSGRGA